MSSTIIVEKKYCENNQFWATFDYNLIFPNMVVHDVPKIANIHQNIFLCAYQNKFI